MKIIDLSILESEYLKKLFKGFFDTIQASLEIKNKGKTNLSKFIDRISEKKNVTFQTLLDNQNNIQFKHFAFFIKSIRSLEKNPTYPDSIEWKILQLLSSIRIENPIPTIEAIEYLDRAGFLREDNFSVISMANVIYCLSHHEPVSAAEMLVRINALNLLTEQNIGKIAAMQHATSGFLPKIVHKLNLVEENATSHLLNQTNLNKLLENSKLNLEILAQFIQVEDKSKVLAEKKFDLAMILNQLLTQENIEKIEKTAFESTQLIKVSSLLDQNQLLNQENLDHLLGLNKDDFEKIVPVLDTMNGSKILNQDNLLKFLDTFLATRIYDEQVDIVDFTTSRQSSKVSLTDKLLMMLKNLFDNISKKIQVLFDKIIDGFNKISKRHDEKQAEVINNLEIGSQNRNAFFSPNSHQSEMSGKYKPQGKVCYVSNHNACA